MTYKWNEYIQYLMDKTGMNGAQLSSRLSPHGQRSLVSQWRTRTGNVTMPMMKRADVFAGLMGLMTYDEYLLTEAKKMADAVSSEARPAAVKRREEMIQMGLIRPAFVPEYESSGEIQCTAPGSIGICPDESRLHKAEGPSGMIRTIHDLGIPGDCKKCRFCQRDLRVSASFFTCVLFNVSLFSNAEGEVLKYKDCV